MPSVTWSHSKLYCSLYCAWSIHSTVFTTIGLKEHGSYLGTLTYPYIPEEGGGKF